MKFEFLVHRAHDTTMSKTVEVDGETISASLPAFEVEFVSLRPNAGSWTVRFVGNEATEARTKFIRGETISFTA